MVERTSGRRYLRRTDREIYNLGGQRLRTLLNGLHPAGRHQAYWNGEDDQGRPVSSGMYLIRLQSENQVRHGEAVCQDQSSRATRPDPHAGGVAQLRRPRRLAGPTPWDDRESNRLTPAAGADEPSHCGTHAPC